MTEETLARALRALPAAPPAWMAAARELPAHGRASTACVTRAQADPLARAAVLADLEGALRAAGLAPEPTALAALRPGPSGDRPPE